MNLTLPDLEEETINFNWTVIILLLVSIIVWYLHLTHTSYHVNVLLQTEWKQSVSNNTSQRWIYIILFMDTLGITFHWIMFRNFLMFGLLLNQMKRLWLQNVWCLNYCCCCINLCKICLLEVTILQYKNEIPNITVTIEIKFIKMYLHCSSIFIWAKPTAGCCQVFSKQGYINCLHLTLWRRI